MSYNDPLKYYKILLFLICFSVLDNYKVITAIARNLTDFFKFLSSENVHIETKKGCFSHRTLNSHRCSII